MHILAVEDEPSMAALLESVLTEEGHQVSVATRGDVALEWARKGNYDVIILDLMLPGMDGFEVAKRLRRERVQTPILVLTARDTSKDIVRALDEGADDYLIKPFPLTVFLARVRAVSRRGSIPHPVYFQAGDLMVNTSTHEVTRSERTITLTPREFSLLEALIRNQGRVLPRTRLVEAVWGHDADIEENTLEAFIKLLRQKLEVPGKPKLIRTVRGIGYTLQVCTD